MTATELTAPNKASFNLRTHYVTDHVSTISMDLYSKALFWLSYAAHRFGNDKLEDWATDKILAHYGVNPQFLHFAIDRNTLYVVKVCKNET